MKAHLNLSKSMKVLFTIATVAVAAGTSTAKAATCLEELNLNPVLTTICITGLPIMLTEALKGDLRVEVLAVQRDAEAHLQGGPLTDALAATVKKLKESDARYADYTSEQIEGAIALMR
jgi:hypothetical protein